jgi:hypothetical protein
MLYSYAIWGLESYQTIISFFLTLATLILVSASTYARWRIWQQPQYRNYLVPDPTIRKFWKGFTVIIAIAIVWQFLPLFLRYPIGGDCCRSNYKVKSDRIPDIKP